MTSQSNFDADRISCLIERMISPSSDFFDAANAIQLIKAVPASSMNLWKKLFDVMDAKLINSDYIPIGSFRLELNPESVLNAGRYHIAHRPGRLEIERRDTMPWKNKSGHACLLRYTKQGPTRLDVWQEISEITVPIIPYILPLSLKGFGRWERWKSPDFSME